MEQLKADYSAIKDKFAGYKSDYTEITHTELPVRIPRLLLNDLKHSICFLGNANGVASSPGS